MDENVSFCGILLAGGKSVRFGGEIEKPFVFFIGKMLFEHSLDVMCSIDRISSIVIVAPERRMLDCEGFCHRDRDARGRIKFVVGGETRQESVYRALLALSPVPHYVIIHDAARPLVARDHFLTLMAAAETCGNVIMALPVAETVIMVDERGLLTASLNRERIRISQTPQLFRYRDLIEAHEAARQKQLVATDDATLVASSGAAVRIIEGSAANIKITAGNDLDLAECLYRSML